MVVKLCRMNAAYWKSCHRHYQEADVFKVVVLGVEEHHGNIVDIEIISPGCKWKKNPCSHAKQLEHCCSLVSSNESILPI